MRHTLDSYFDYKFPRAINNKSEDTSEQKPAFSFGSKILERPLQTQLQYSNTLIDELCDGIRERMISFL
jgi:hypothetical protein